MQNAEKNALQTRVKHQRPFNFSQVIRAFDISGQDIFFFPTLEFTKNGNHKDRKKFHSLITHKSVADKVTFYHTN